MEAKKHITERDMPGVKPLVLSGRTIVIIVVVAIVLWSVSIFLWKQVEFDKSMLIGLNELRTNQVVMNLAQLVSKYGMPLIVLVYLLYLLFAFRNEALRDTYRIYLLVFLMFGLAGIGGDILKEILNRPRPFIEYAGEISALSDAATPALPSGHATKSVALALPFLLLLTTKDNWHKAVKFLMAVIVFAVCCSRVLLGAHYVSDVLAGIGTALVCFPLVAVINNRILSSWTVERLNSAAKIWAVILFGLMIYLILF
jgi:membrane-associated phospholipid phosphatase